MGQGLTEKGQDMTDPAGAAVLTPAAAGLAVKPVPAHRVERHG